MRLEINLEPQKEQYKLPINYNSFVYDELMKITRGQSHFTFSRMKTINLGVDHEHIYAKGLCTMEISTPEEEIINQIFKSLKKQIHFKSAKFRIKSLKPKSLPEFSEVMNYKMASPTVVTILNDDYVLFCKPDDYQTIELLEHDLKDKYFKKFGDEYDGKLEIQLDKQYLHCKQWSKFIKFHRPSEGLSFVKSFLCPLTIKADSEMQKIAYVEGIGHMNKLGFGLLTVDHSNK